MTPFSRLKRYVPHPPQVLGRVVADLIRYFPATVAPIIGFAVFTGVFTHVFHPQSYGVYVLAMSIVAPMIGILTHWILRPAIRYYAEARVEGQSAVYMQAFVNLTVVALAGGLVFGAVCAVALWPGGFLQANVALCSGVFGFLLAGVLNANLMALVRAQLKSSWYLACVVVAEIVSAGAAIALVFLVGRQVAWLAWAQVAGLAAVIPLLCFVTGVNPLKLSYSSEPATRAVMGRFVRYGIPMTIWWVGANLLSVEDRYVVAIFGGVTQVAVYTVNYGFIAGAASLLNGTITLAFGPSIFHDWSRGLRNEVAVAIGRTTEIYFFLGACFIGGVVVFSVPIEGVVVGHAFRAGLLILIPLAVGMTLNGLGIVGHKCLELGEGSRAMALSAIVAGVLNLALNLMLVPAFGYVAAAFVTAATYGVYVGMIWWQSKHFVPWQINLVSLARALVAACVAVIVALVFLQATGETTGFILLAIILYLASFAFFSAALAFGHLPASAKIVDAPRSLDP